MPSLSGREPLERWIETLGLNLGRAQWAHLEDYLLEVSKHNEKVNLTSDSGGALFLRHAADALAALPLLKRHLGRLSTAPEILDVGAGAGFIGITLKIAWPDARITLLESSQRKFRFLNWACANLKMAGLRVMLGRAPAALGGKTFDAVLVRAVAPLESSARLGLSSAHPDGGFCLCYQTLAPDTARLGPTLRGLAAGVLEIAPYRLPGENSDRHLVLLKNFGGHGGGGL